MNNYKISIYIFIACLIAQIAGCSSSHNFKEDGFSVFGGGFSEEEILPGFYRMYALSNRGLIVSNSAAERTFRNRAEILCKGQGFKEFNIDTYISSSDAMPLYIVDVGIFYFQEHQASKSGYFVCNNSNITVDKAKEYLLKKINEAKERREKENLEYIASLKYKNCNTSISLDSETSYYKIGKSLHKANKYKEARECFLKSIINDTNQNEVNDANFHLGMMHELGQGIPSDFKKAKEFYRQAGLIED